MLSESGLISVTGGKWTTSRKMAEDVVEQVEIVAELVARSCQTIDLRIHGAGGAGTVHDHGKSDNYGTDAAASAELAKTGTDAHKLLNERLTLTVAEVVWHCRHEMARTVEDVLARRTRWLLLDAIGSIDAAPQVAAVMARERDLGADWIADQVREYTKLAAGYAFKNPASTAPT